MKKRIFAVAMTAMMTVSMAVTAFAADTTSNLIGKFTFDENVTNEVTGTDASVVAKGNGGTVGAAVEGATWTYVDGVDGKAIQLNKDGDTNGLNLNLKVADDQNYTFSVWLKALGCNFANPVVWMGKSVQAPENWVGIWPGLNGDWASGPQLGSNDAAATRLGSATPKVDLTDAANNEGLGIKKPTDATLKTTFEWTNVTIVIKEGLGWLYYDGKLVGSTEGVTDSEGNQYLMPGVNSEDDDTVSIYLGANGWDAPFNGYVDDLYIYDRALSTEDVAALVAETNKAGVALGEFSEYVTTTTINWTKKPQVVVDDIFVEADDESEFPWPVVIGAAVVVVLVVVIVLVLVISKSKKKGTEDKEV